MLVHNGGCTRVSAFEKAYFQILFFSQKKGKKGNPRIEFSPANKKKRREHVLQKLCSVYVCSQQRTRVFSTCSPENMVFTTSLTKRGDFASFIIVFSRVFHGQKITKKNSFYTPLTKRGDFAFLLLH